MNRDEFGMPEEFDECDLSDPHHHAKKITFRYAVYQHDKYLDWSTHDCECMARYAAFLASENAKFREIVRRLATSKSVSDLMGIATDAEKLWSKMQSEAKGNE